MKTKTKEPTYVSSEDMWANHTKAIAGNNSTTDEVLQFGVNVIGQAIVEAVVNKAKAGADMADDDIAYSLMERVNEHLVQIIRENPVHAVPDLHLATIAGEVNSASRLGHVLSGVLQDASEKVTANEMFAALFTVAGATLAHMDISVGPHAGDDDAMLADAMRITTNAMAHERTMLAAIKAAKEAEEQVAEEMARKTASVH